MIECSKCGEDVRYCACDCNLCYCACITESDLAKCDCGCHKGRISGLLLGGQRYGKSDD